MIGFHPLLAWSFGDYEHNGAGIWLNLDVDKDARHLVRGGRGEFSMRASVVDRDDYRRTFPRIATVSTLGRGKQTELQLYGTFL